jgi:hypothetical protein
MGKYNRDEPGRHLEIIIWKRKKEILFDHSKAPPTSGSGWLQDLFEVQGRISNDKDKYKLGAFC